MVTGDGTGDFTFTSCQFSIYFIYIWSENLICMFISSIFIYIVFIYTLPYRVYGVVIPYIDNIYYLAICSELSIRISDISMLFNCLY